jgi:uncharacterized membrane protein YagU involved in acid resistance
VAGVISGVAKDILDSIFYYGFHFGNYRYLDFAAMIIYGQKPTFWWDAVFAQFIELIFSGLLGVLYFVLIPRETNRNHIMKGWLYGVSIWLFLCTMGMIYKTPFFTKTPWQTTNSDFLTSSVYGIVLALALRFLDKKYESP